MNVTDSNIHSIIKAAHGAKGGTKCMLTLIRVRQSATRHLELIKIHKCDNILRYFVGPPYRV